MYTMKFRCFLNPQKIILDRIIIHTAEMNRLLHKKVNNAKEAEQKLLHLEALDRLLSRMWKLYSKGRKTK